jgi:SAM-dependent methyltransferase
MRSEPTPSATAAIHSSADPEGWHYPNIELDSMAFAVNYHRWILEALQPFLGKHILEVGAGRGSLSELLIESGTQSLTALEPSANMYPQLVHRLAAIGASHVESRQCTLLQAFADQARPPRQPDSIVYVNVLEHIEADEAELRAAHDVLPSGGRVLIFAPAHQWLMGSLDRRIGHVRRYSMRELTAKCQKAGFRICRASHFDFFGIAPWWLKYRLLKSSRVETGTVRLYDRCIVPIARAIERKVHPPIGKNLIVVGEKPA